MHFNNKRGTKYCNNYSPGSAFALFPPGKHFPIAIIMPNFGIPSLPPFPLRTSLSPYSLPPSPLFLSLFSFLQLSTSLCVCDIIQQLFSFSLFFFYSPTGNKAELIQSGVYRYVRTSSNVYWSIFDSVVNTQNGPHFKMKMKTLLITCPLGNHKNISYQ